MNGEQMVTVTRFAAALARMSQAAKANEPIELSAEENAAMVEIVKTLTNRSRPPVSSFSSSVGGADVSGGQG